MGNRKQSQEIKVMDIEKFREIIAKANNENTTHAVFVNPFESNGGIAKYIPEHDLLLLNDNTCIAIDSIKNVNVHNGHFIIEVPAWNVVNDEYEPVSYHLYILTVLNVNEM